MMEDKPKKIMPYADIASLGFSKTVVALIKANTVITVVPVETSDKIKEMIEQFNQASLASENLKNELEKSIELAPKLLVRKDSPSNKPFYYNVPKYRKNQRR